MKTAILYASASALNIAVYFCGEPSFISAFLAGLCAAMAMDTLLNVIP
jgi:hypothetical protein